MTREKICIIGTGNVATHLLKAFKHLDVRAVNSREIENIPADASIYIIAVKDDVIEKIAGGIPAGDAIVAHTSGSVPMQAVSRYHTRAGVLYPLQTFSKDTEMSYSDIPVFIEASDAETDGRLKRLARNFSPHIFDADSAVREKLHIAAVFSCNFVNHLYSLAASELREEGIPFDVLRPLARRTLEKAFDSGQPEQVQTGPAARGDMSVISKHIRNLADKRGAQTIYRVISESILKGDNN